MPSKRESIRSIFLSLRDVRGDQKGFKTWLWDNTIGSKSRLSFWGLAVSHLSRHCCMANEKRGRQNMRQTMFCGIEPAIGQSHCVIHGPKKITLRCRHWSHFTTSVGNTCEDVQVTYRPRHAGLHCGYVRIRVGCVHFATGGSTGLKRRS